MSFNCIVLAKRDMNKAALICIHRRKRNRATLPNSTGGSRVSHRNNFVMSTTLVPLNINNDRIPKSKFAAHKQGNKNLKGFKGTSMTTDKDGKIRSRNIQNKLTIIAIVLINRRRLGVKVRENGAKHGNSDVSDGIELLVRKLLTSFITLSDLRILTSSYGRILGKNLSNFLRHHKLPY